MSPKFAFVFAIFALPAFGLAQSPVSPAPSVAETFRRLDRNGDGRLDRAEAGTMGFFNAADANGDSFVTSEEAQALARRQAAPVPGTSGMEGDGAAPVFQWPVPPVEIPQSLSPVEKITGRSADDGPVEAWLRRPKSAAAPCIIFIHGGLTQFPERSLRRHLTHNPVITRLLESGYAVVMATFRSYGNDIQSRGPIEDVRAVVKAAATLPGIAPGRLALFGGSGGGNIALELGSDPSVGAVIVGEPATLIYTGMLTTGDYGPRLEMMANPEPYLTTELRAKTVQKLKGLQAPVLMLHSDQHDLRKLNQPLFLPMMKEAGVDVEYREYPGYGHGFYFGSGQDRWGKGADLAVVEGVVKDVDAYLRRVLP